MAPRSAFALSHLSEAHRHAGNYDQAVTLARRAMESQPEFDNAHLVLGMALVKQGRYDEPKEHFEWVLENGRELELASDQLGALESDAGHIDRAIEAFAQGAKLVPPARLRYTLNIAVLQFTAGRAEAARSTLESVRSNLNSPDPNIAKGWYLLGELYRIEGRFDEAKDCYRSYLSVTSDAQGPSVAQMRSDASSQFSP